MKFGILEIKGKSRIIIDVVSNANDFALKVQNKDATIKCINCVSLETLKNHKEFENRKYIVILENQIFLVEKTSKIKKGYIYNSFINELEILSSWEALPYDIQDQEIQKPQKINRINNLIISRKRINKIKCVKKILDEYDFNNTVICCQNEKSVKDYKKMNSLTNQITIHNNVNNAMIRDVIISFSKSAYDNTLVLDIHSQNVIDLLKNNDIINVINNKNCDKSIILILSYPINLSDEIKNHFHNFIIHSDDFNVNQKRIYEMYCKNTFKHFDDYKKSAECAQPIVISNAENCIQNKIL